ncbi:SulP family inorganic anion transporter [Streptomyces sp. NBRC 110611]|uniref:SulP family inorganic anion transporter n=1 Tax=Streptomyces sp. NBRC 110611 TaxID=1621259 RepID=UPI001C683615|nr:SulP family inorganic anion transporter [Streptomyces sp. NBRC 110611]
MCRTPRKDLLAGATVAVAALPLSLGFGVASGLGAQAGLVSAIVAGAVAAVLGGSKLQVTGPTGVLAVVLLPVAHVHGAPGVLTCGLLAGIILVAMALLGVSRYARLLPVPVVTGFITGSAAVIICQQIPLVLGSHSAGESGIVASAARALTGVTVVQAAAPAAVAVAVLVVCLAGSRLRPSVPFPLLAVIAAAVVTHLADLPLATIGSLPGGLPSPSLGFVTPGIVPHLLPSAFTVAALCALESLMTAAAADAMSGQGRHDGNRVLFGQGAANLITSAFGGVAATGTVCRTGINIRSGAASRLSALANSAAITFVVLAAAPLVTAIPLAALAGVLIATAVRMTDLAALRALARSSYGQIVVAALTATITVMFNLVTAVAAGMMLTALLALHAVAKTAKVQHVLTKAGIPRQSPPPRDTPHSANAASITVYRIDGPLLFATAERLLKPVTQSTAAVVIVQMSRVTATDATGILALGDAIDTHHRHHAHVLLSGVRDHHRHHLDALGILDRLHPEERTPFTTPAHAIRYAQQHFPNPPTPPRTTSAPS